MFRGVAILLMVLFHINYSLVNIFGIEFFNFSELFWYIVGKISAIGFIFIAGISFFLAGEKNMEYLSGKSILNMDLF